MPITSREKPKSRNQLRRAPGVQRLAAPCLLLVCLLGAIAPAFAYEFEIFEVAGAPITGGRGLDDHNCQVGYSQSDAGDFSTARAILRCDGQIEFIDPPTSLADRRAFDINSAGVVVGSALRASGADGFEFDGVSYTWIEYPGAEQTVVRGINDLGDVVGEYENAGGARRGFARFGGTFVSIDVPLAVESRARGINNHGEIVGSWTDGSGRRHAFTRTPDGIFTTFDYPGALETVLGDINDAGEIVGTYFDNGGTPHGFVISAPLVQFLPFDVPGSTGTVATGINEAAELTGEWIDGEGVRRGFVARFFLFTDGFESGDLEAWSSTFP
ncbi:MAG: DUF3466 family protein [Holophagales bacterium]|nr:DUF3466 family protein [Holophagales bacterium]